VPLSKGRLDGTVVCGYHGLKFNAQGRCTHALAGHHQPSACVRSYPVVERHRFIWLWMGDAGDPLVPDLRNDDPAWAGGGADHS
jgi:vanillate O-demethylase monooxygenase subunit